MMLSASAIESSSSSFHLSRRMTKTKHLFLRQSLLLSLFMIVFISISSPSSSSSSSSLQQQRQRRWSTGLFHIPIVMAQEGTGGTTDGNVVEGDTDGVTSSSTTNDNGTGSVVEGDTDGLTGSSSDADGNNNNSDNNNNNNNSNRGDGSGDERVEYISEKRQGREMMGLVPALAIFFASVVFCTGFWWVATIFLRSWFQERVKMYERLARDAQRAQAYRPPSYRPDSSQDGDHDLERGGDGGGGGSGGGPGGMSSFDDRDGSVMFNPLKDVRESTLDLMKLQEANQSVGTYNPAKKIPPSAFMAAKMNKKT